MIRTPGVPYPKISLVTWAHGPTNAPWRRWMSGASSKSPMGFPLTGCSHDLGHHQWPWFDSSLGDSFIAWWASYGSCFITPFPFLSFDEREIGDESQVLEQNFGFFLPELALGKKEKQAIRSISGKTMHIDKAMPIYIKYVTSIISRIGMISTINSHSNIWPSEWIFLPKHYD